MESGALDAVGTADRAMLERNVRLIPIHQGMAGAFFWIPVMVLFTRGRFDLDGALLLGSMYYLFVVAVEVPSGWMSDRLGRVLTLRAAAASWVVAQSCFLFGGQSFAAIAVGQFFLAAGFASLSGTDVTFHFDTLEALGRAGEYAGRQARVSAIGFAVTAVSAVVGGSLGLISLRLAFLASLGMAVAQLALTMGLSEPHPVPGRAGVERLQAGRSGQGFGWQLVHCVRYLRRRYLAWIFFYGVVMVTLEHVAVTLLQPWLTEMLGRSPQDVGAAPLFSGFVYASFSVVGAGAARVSAPLEQRFGTVTTLIGLAALSAAIVTGMALWVSAAVLLLVVFRSAQGAAAPVLISAAVAPRVRREHRATLLSLNSLGGRLGYGLLLLAVSGVAADDVQPVLRLFAVLAWALVALLIATALLLHRRELGDVPAPAT